MVEAVVPVAVASCQYIAVLHLLHAVMQRDLSQASPAVLILAVVVVGVDQQVAAADADAAAAVVVA